MSVIALVPISSPVQTPDGAGGYTSEFQPLPGSPFLARLMRKNQVQFHRDEDAPGFVTVDDMQVLSFIDITVPLNEKCVATLPDGSVARIMRVRKYNRRLECDLEVLTR